MRPKVVLAAGNCLVGNPERNRDSLAITWLSAGGANQLVGYTGTPELGLAGWGTLQLWTRPPGANTLSEAFYLANQRVAREVNQASPELLALANASDLNPLERNTRLLALLAQLPKETRKRTEDLFRELDAAVFYGDPKWEAWLGRGRSSEASWTPAAAGGWKLTLQFSDDAQLINHWMFLMPSRVANPVVTAEGGLKAWVTENAVSLADGQWLEGGRTYTLTVTGQTTAKQ